MAFPILMPALSPTMEEGKLAKWLVKEGDPVQSGDIIAEIETDKATMEVEATEEGSIGKIAVQDGTDNVKVGTQIAFILAEGETVDAINALSSVSVTLPSSQESAETSKNIQASNSAPVAEASLNKNSENRIKASPLARRIASQSNIDLKSVNGSGPKGRIVKADIETLIANGSQDSKVVAHKNTQTANNIPANKAQSDEAVMALYDKDAYDVAARLLESKVTIPHFYLNADINLDSLLDLRKTLNARAPLQDDKPTYKLSVNDFIIKALALSLQQIPDANVTWTDNSGILKHKHSDVAVAVSVEGGLFTPVIRKAEQKSLTLISHEMKDLAKRARLKKLSPQEYQGGTSTVSNLGMYQVKNFNAIINPPHASILAIGAGEQKPIVKDNALAIGTVMCATLSIDHRAVDGALGADLLKTFKGFIEDPIGLLI